MESEANNSLTVPSSDDDDILSPHLDEDVLRHIATFLDFNSIRQFRLISREWNAAFLPILMKRGHYNLIRSSYGNEERLDLLEGAEHYSSWKLSYSVYNSANFLHDNLLLRNQMWGNVRSLSIHQPTPLSREFHRWVWKTLEEVRCPNLQELTLILEARYDGDEEVDSEVESVYEQAILGLPNASFPNNASNLRLNLSSLHFKGIYDKTTAYFAQNLLQATTPSLRHLHFCPIRPPSDVYKDIGAFRIFVYLQRNPTLTKNLQSFGFILGHYSTTSNHNRQELFRRDASEKFVELLRFVITLALPLQFSENLRSLFWDSPFYHDDYLLPGVLYPSIASSLVHLCLNGRVERLIKEYFYGKQTVKISFPNFTRLRTLKLGPNAAAFIYVPELVDSAPNLQVLEIKKGIIGHFVIRNDMNDCWRVNSEGSCSNAKHSQLEVFCTDRPFHGLQALQMISSKFPNLVELRLGRVEEVGLHTFLSILSSNHSNLKRLTWTYMDTNIEKIELDELFRHLTRIPEQLPTLKSYSFGHDRSPDDNNLSISMRVMQKSANILLSLPSNSDSYLIINLLIPYLTCPRHCNPEKRSALDVNCSECYLNQFIGRHNLPIQIHSARKIEEMELKHEKNDHFATFLVYK
jgi:hypothetical protein